MSTNRPHAPRRSGSVAHKVMLGTAVLALLCFGLTAALIYRKASEALVDTSRQTMTSEARSEARQVASDLGDAFVASGALAHSVQMQRRLGGIDRATVAGVLEDASAAHPEWIGTSTLWEPDAFDGRDAEFVDSPAHDASGRFMSYWARTGGTLVQSPMHDYETPGEGDWYLRPRQQQAPTVAEPYLYEVGGRAGMADHLVHAGDGRREIPRYLHR